MPGTRWTQQHAVLPVIFSAAIGEIDDNLQFPAARDVGIREKLGILQAGLDHLHRCVTYCVRVRVC